MIEKMKWKKMIDDKERKSLKRDKIVKEIIDEIVWPDDINQVRIQEIYSEVFEKLSKKLVNLEFKGERRNVK